MNGMNGTRHGNMKTEYSTYQLEVGSKKHICPRCRKKRFVRYVDTHTGNYLSVQYGRCDREIKCAYHQKPCQTELRRSKVHEQNGKNIPNIGTSKAERFHLPMHILRRTQLAESYVRNQFLINLLTNVPFPVDFDALQEVVHLYKLGTIAKGYMEGALTLPFINRSGHVRAIQAKSFDEQNHTVHTNWIHSLAKQHYDKSRKRYPVWLEEYLKNDRKVDCLFGEHLLSSHSTNPVALVEAPKTAIYATLYFGSPSNPNKFLWLSVFNLSSLNIEKCRVLAGRRIVLFPDLSSDGKAFKLWKDRSRLIEMKIPGASVAISDLLERYANDAERAAGLDLADYLIKLDWRDFKGDVV